MSSAFRRGGSGRKSGSRSNVTATLVPPTGGNTLSSNINEKNLGTSTAMTAAVAGIVDKGEETTIHSLDDGQDKPSSTSTHTSTSKNSNRRHSHSSNRLLLSAEKGIKAWAGGIHLTSTGLNDLDSILGGGQPLGTSILIRQDRWTADLASSLVKYWCAEVRYARKNLLVYSISSPLPRRGIWRQILCLPFCQVLYCTYFVGCPSLSYWKVFLVLFSIFYLCSIVSHALFSSFPKRQNERTTTKGNISRSTIDYSYFVG